MTMLGDFRRMVEQINARHEPLGYIVLDHSQDPRERPQKRRDGHGRTYIVCSPAILDEGRHVAPRPEAPGGMPLFGINVYRRESMPDDWPDYAGRDAGPMEA